MQGVNAFGHGIYAVDSGYTGSGVAAIHLIEEGGRAALVDTGNNAALEHVEQALAETGLSPESVDYVLLTHIHLDHAGGAGADDDGVKRGAAHPRSLPPPCALAAAGRSGAVACCGAIQNSYR